MYKWRIVIVVLIVVAYILVGFPKKSNTSLSGSLQTKSLKYPTERFMLDNQPLLTALSLNQLENLISSLSENDFPEPKQWGLHVTGVKQQLDTDEKVIALTFDACGSATGNEFDHVLIDYLKKKKIPATLFINERWIVNNEKIFQDLANTDLFQIENHGTDHQPLSFNGNNAYGIQGTTSLKEVIDEVFPNYYTIYDLTGKLPNYFRSGTAHYDEVAVSVLNQLGVEVVNFDINGDAGATYSADKVKQSLLHAEPGSIAILHMNQPSSGTAKGVAMAIPQLQKQGFEFVKLEDYDLK